MSDNDYPIPETYTDFTHDIDVLLRLTKEQQAEIDRLRSGLSACGLDNQAYFDRCEQLATEIAKLRDDFGEALVRENNLIAALEEIEAMCSRGESHTWIARTARKALANESYDQAMTREHGPDLIRER